MAWLTKVALNCEAFYALAAAVSAGLLGGFLLYRRRRRAFKDLDIRVITTQEQCDVVIQELTKRCLKHGAVGFDCEWVTVEGRRQPVSLLQLSSYDGLCGLFRLNHLNQIPTSLTMFLEDPHIYKLGIGPIDDAKYLTIDYSVTVKGALDIRHIARNNGHEPGGLDTLSRRHLGVSLDKHWKIRASDWSAETLTQRQILYAANDAFVAIKIFEKLLQARYGLFFIFKRNVWSNIGQICKRYADLPFTAKPSNPSSECKQTKKSVREKKYSASARSKPLYQNGFMLAPDGELLCTCDNKKAQWYIDKGLADKVKDEPFTVKLRFEPAGRAVGEVGRYYQLEKENKCVVCGKDNSYIRKNVVPREYRKYFPDIMKDHSSHDVVLLCLRCHQCSNISDQAVRLQLATQCDAPLCHAHDINKEKYIEDADAKTLRSAARALLHDSKNHNLPPQRRRECESRVLRHFPHHSEVTDELLSEACSVQILYENENYESHGQKVVEKYIHEAGGLLKLEKIWREHFIETMEPKYLPELWCVNHNEERLMIRVREGRIDPADMKIIGLDIINENLVNS